MFTVSASGVVTALANGSGTLTASFDALSATAQVVVAQAPATLAVVSGDGQEGMPGETLSEPVAVRVNDAGGSPVAGVTVTFAPEEGHGSADPVTAAADVDGQASTNWTLGDATGAQSLTVSAGDGVSVVAGAIAVGQDPARAAAITISPPSATLASLGETASLTAEITDQYGVAFPGTAAWSSSDPGVFTVSASGVVTAVANGSGTLTATFEALSATAQVVVAQVPAAVVVVSGDGQEGAPGSTLAEPVVVRVDDAGGSPVAGATVRFMPAARHGSADPATAAADVDGQASTNWTLGDATGTQSLTASAGDGVSTEVRATAVDQTASPDSAVYRIVFNATWSSTTHPTNFPRGAHFSSLIGAVHNDGVSFWARGQIATRGIETMAETGATGNLASEIRARTPTNALSVIGGGAIGSPGSTTISRVLVRTHYPLVTLVTMIAPSPDWFVGVSGLSLMDEFGQWVDELEVVLYPYDSGTDDGTSYTSANADSSPKQPIRSLRGVAPFSDAPIGTFTFTRVGGS